MIDLEKSTFLSNSEMEKLAPSIFTETPSSEVSKHYTHISTSRVIDDMRILGWDVTSVQEVKARKETTMGVQKHLVIFRNPDVTINGADGDTVFPQILLTNSHDGKNKFQFTAGLFRLVCANGLVISDTNFEDVKMRHMGYTFEELQDNIKAMVERLPLTTESMNRMKSIEIGGLDALEFAKKCITTRFTKEEVEEMNVDYVELLNPTRVEDQGEDVWSRFNVVQEKVLGGDFRYSKGNKIRKARRVKNFSQDQKINKELFSIALDYVN